MLEGEVICSPPPNSRMWNAHPRVYLAIDPKSRSARCYYCGTEYILTPAWPGDDSFCRIRDSNAAVETFTQTVLPVAGTTLIEHNILQLKRNGIKDLVINLGCLGDMIKAHLGNGSHLVYIQYAKEPSDRLLGSGGGVKQAYLYLANYHLYRQR